MLFSFFEKLIDPFPNNPQGQPPSSLLAFIWFYSKGVWPFLLLNAILVGIISATEVLLFGFLGNIVDWLATVDRETFLVQERTTLLWMAGVVLVFLPLVSTIYSLVFNQTLQGNFMMIPRWLGHRYLLRQSYAFYQDEFAGRVSTKLMQTAQAFREVGMKFSDTLAYAATYFLGATLLASTFDFWLLFPFLLWFMGYAWLLWFILPQMADSSKNHADKTSVMTGRVVDSYTNMMTIKLFSHANHEDVYARESMQEALTAFYALARLVTFLKVGLHVLNALLLFSISSLALWSWLNHGATVGAVAVCIGLVLRVIGMSHWIMWEMSALFQNLGTLRDGMGLLAQAQSVVDVADAQDIVVDKGIVAFKDVSFHYGKDTGVIEQLSLKIQAGEKIGLVGHSGAGKTTLTNLLLRLFDVESGRIEIDGQDISRVTQDSLRHQIGVVTQDSALLHRSVAENIRYGSPEATMDEVIAAAKRANAHEFIESLEDAQGCSGYDAQVGERGVKLSGGQRQRISIARMFLKDAPILVLDEATSALDSEVESVIQVHLNELMEGKTVISIAHRLSTIAAMDRLIVLDKGQIQEQGTHTELLAREGIYAKLWTRQSGGFIASNLSLEKK